MAVIVSPVLEVEGPPCAYFEISDGINIVRRVYRTLRSVSDEAIEDAIDAIRNELATKHADNFPMIFWRRHPRPGDPSARLITSPPLSNEFWRSLGCWDSSGTGDFPP